MVSTGLASTGFRQINIDSGYLNRKRDSQGQMVPNSTKFPSGMRALADYLASRPISLGLGLYTDITNHTCGPHKGGPGAWGHYKQDDGNVRSLEYQLSKSGLFYFFPTYASLSTKFSPPRRLTYN